MNQGVPPSCIAMSWSASASEGRDKTTSRCPLRCDEQGGGAALHCDVLVGPLASESRRTTFGAGAQRDIADQGDAAPLFIASQSGHLEVVRLLSVAGADKHMTPRGGLSVLSQGPRGTSQIRVMPPPCSSHLQGSGATLHCDVLVGPCTDHVEVSTLRCDEQGSGTALRCDVLVGSCVREQTDLLAH